jgi:alpha-1,2-mannosyltransferase
VLAVSIVVYLVIARLRSHQMWIMIDLQIYRAAGDAARHGYGVYNQTYDAGLPFTYPPFAAVVFEPLSFLPLSVLRVLLVSASLGALLSAVWLSFGALGIVEKQRRLRLTLVVSAFAVWLEPVQQNLRFGQINLLLLALVLADLLQPDDRRWKGAGVGLATGLKLTPAIFIAYLVLTRRLRAAATAVGVFAATVVVGVIALPSSSHKYWINHLFFDSERVGGVAFLGNQSLQGAIARFAHGVGPAAAYWRPLALLVAVVGLGAAVRAKRCGTELGAVLICGVTGLLVSPVSWSHHWVYVAPALALAVGWALRDGRRAAWLVPGVGFLLFAAWPGHTAPRDPLSTAGLIWLAPNADDREFSWSILQQAVGNLETVVGLGLLAVGVYLCVRHRPAPLAKG